MDHEKKIIYRKVLWNNEYYYEYLFINLNKQLCLPTKIPEKYLKRILNQTIFQFTNCYEVQSKPNCEIQKISKTTLFDGIWLLADDCMGKGALEDTENIVQFMSFIINDAQLIQNFNLEKKDGIQVYSLYHGTHAKNVDSILQTGLLESNGMLGNGIYCGTFWKACRFACFSQTYEKQDGAIFRIIVKGNIKILPNDKWKCSCCENIIADHLSYWKYSETYDGICAKPTITSLINKDGKPKYLLKNEEWCIKKEFIILTHVGLINCTDYQYNPLDRKIHIN